MKKSTMFIFGLTAIGCIISFSVYVPAWLVVLLVGSLSAVYNEEK